LAPLSVSVMAMRIVEELNRGLIKVASPDSGRRATTSPLLFTRTSLVAGNFREVPRRITRERQHIEDHDIAWIVLHPFRGTPGATFSRVNPKRRR
jgi:hypothetical protein